MTEPNPTRWARLHDAFAAMREMIVVLAILGIVFAPERVQNVLRKAGIQSFAGLEFDADVLAESEAAVEHAKTKVAQLERELVVVQHELGNLATSPVTIADPRLQTVSKLVEQMQQKVDETEHDLQESLMKQHDLLHRHGYADVGETKPAEPESAPESTTDAASEAADETAMLPPDEWIR